MANNEVESRSEYFGSAKVINVASVETIEKNGSILLREDDSRFYKIEFPKRIH